MNYVEELERQNEELKQKLASAENFIDWHNARLHSKLFFTYDIMFTHENHDYTLDITREAAKYVIDMRKSVNHNSYLLKLPSMAIMRGKEGSKAKVSVIAWKSAKSCSAIADHRTIFEFII